MQYLSVAETAKKWAVSEGRVRAYCRNGRIPGAFLSNRAWHIPEDVQKPSRIKTEKNKPQRLLDILQDEKQRQYSGGIYHKTQIELTYNSNHMEGSQLTHDQTRYIFETNTIGIENSVLNVDDVIETSNHFRCIDLIIDRANVSLSQPFIKNLHRILKTGTSDARKEWFSVGEYKKTPNEVGGVETTLSEEVLNEMADLLVLYNNKKEKN